MSFHAFKDDEGNEFGSFEAFRVDATSDTYTDDEGDQHTLTPGWYWWACFPGCLPDSEPSGPFATEQEAIGDAQGDA
jgi:hypothetical protein